MSENTTRLKIPHPSEGDAPDVPLSLGQLASFLDFGMVGFIEDTIAKRPEPGVNNRVFMASDTGVLYLDRVSSWKQILLTGQQAFEQSFITTATEGVGTVNNSEHSVEVRKGARVEWRGIFEIGWNNTDNPFVDTTLVRDGLTVAGHNTKVGQTGGDGWCAFTDVLTYIEAEGGTHTFRVVMNKGGSIPTFRCQSGILVVGT